MTTATETLTPAEAPGTDWRRSDSPPEGALITEVDRAAWPHMTPEARQSLLTPARPSSSDPRRGRPPLRIVNQDAPPKAEITRLFEGLALRHKGDAQEPPPAEPTRGNYLSGIDAPGLAAAQPWRALSEPEAGPASVHSVRVRSGLVGRRMAMTFAAYDPQTPLQRQARDLCARFAERYDPALSDGGVPGLTLHSPPHLVGCGKTHLVCAAGNALLARGLRPVRYVRLKLFLDALKASFGRRDADASSVWAEYLAPRVVLLDDLGKEELGRDAASREWALNQVFELVSEWDNLGTRVLRTTNDDEAALEARYGVPLASRLMGLSAGRVVPVDGPDMRFARAGYDDFFA